MPREYATSDPAPEPRPGHACWNGAVEADELPEPARPVGVRDASNANDGGGAVQAPHELPEDLRSFDGLYADHARDVLAFFSRVPLDPPLVTLLEPLVHQVALALERSMLYVAPLTLGLVFSAACRARRGVEGAATCVV